VTGNGVPEPWWGDESPVGTDRRRRNGVAERASSPRHEPAPEPEPRPGAWDDAAWDDAAWDDRGASPNGSGPHGSAPSPHDPDQGVGADGAGPSRSRAQFFVPPPEELPPFEEVVERLGRGRRRGADPAGAGPTGFTDPRSDRASVASPELAPGRAPGAIPGPRPDPNPLDALPDAAPRPVAADPRPSVQVPDPADFDAADDDIPDAPVLGRPPGARARPPAQRAARGDRPRDEAPAHKPIDRRRLAVVYDVDGPRIRLGVAWFAGAMASLALPVTAAVVFAVAAGFAGRQIVRAWGAVSWHADVAAGLAAVPVLAALAGLPAALGVAVVAVVVAAGCALAPDGARLPGGEGRVAAAAILSLAVVPAVAGAAVVLVRSQSVVAAVVLVLVASAYEVGDYIVGSGASNPIEGPLAGMTTATLVALPLALVLVEPYNTAGIALLGFAAAACPTGQIIASAVLPGAGAHAPALRRIDTLLLLAPLWVAATGAV
jgi:hypothetical protein